MDGSSTSRGYGCFRTIRFPRWRNRETGVKKHKDIQRETVQLYECVWLSGSLCAREWGRECVYTFFRVPDSLPRSGWLAIWPVNSNKDWNSLKPKEYRPQIRLTWKCFTESFALKDHRNTEGLLMMLQISLCAKTMTINAFLFYSGTSSPQKERFSDGWLPQLNQNKPKAIYWGKEEEGLHQYMNNLHRKLRIQVLRP